MEDGPPIARPEFSVLINMGFQHPQLAMSTHSLISGQSSVQSPLDFKAIIATPGFQQAMASAAGTAANSAVKSHIAHTPSGLLSPGAKGGVSFGKEPEPRKRSPAPRSRARSASPTRRRARSRSRSRSPRHRRSRSTSPRGRKKGKTDPGDPSRDNFNKFYMVGCDRIFAKTKVPKDTYECADQAYRASGKCFNETKCRSDYGFLHGQKAKDAKCKLTNRELKNIAGAYKRLYKRLPGHLTGKLCRTSVAPK